MEYIHETLPVHASHNTMCHEQGRQLLHLLFLNYFPLSKLHIVNGVRAITPKLVGCFGLNGPLRQYFSLYRAVSQREGERKEK